MPKKITPAEQAKPTRDEVEAKIKSGFKRLMDRQASPEYRAFVAAVEASKGLTYLDELALKTLVGIERQIPPDTNHPEGIKALECCALAREAKTEMLANYWLRDAVASWKDWMLWDDSVFGGKSRINQSNRAKDTGRFTTEAETRIADQYLIIEGRYGEVKALAARLGITPQQVRNIAEKVYPK